MLITDDGQGGRGGGEGETHLQCINSVPQLMERGGGRGVPQQWGQMEGKDILLRANVMQKKEKYGHKANVMQKKEKYGHKANVMQKKEKWTQGQC